MLVAVLLESGHEFFKGLHQLRVLLKEIVVVVDPPLERIHNSVANAREHTHRTKKEGTAVSECARCSGVAREVV